MRIVLLHGILDSRDVWSRVAEKLRAAGRDASAPASRAHEGGAPWTPGMDWSPRADAQDVLATLKEPVHLVGHSRGGTSASWIAAERPDLAASLAVIASPPQMTEAFRATFRKRIPNATDAREKEALEYLAHIPEDDFPTHALRRYEGRALVVEYEDDPLYSPTHTLFWRAYLPYADFERVPGGHRAFAETDAAAQWLAARILAHVRAAEAR